MSVGSINRIFSGILVVSKRWVMYFYSLGPSWVICNELLSIYKYDIKVRKVRKVIAKFELILANF